MTDPGHGRSLLRAALGFTAIHWHGDLPPAARALATYLDSWTGVGAVVVGRQRLGYVVEMKEFPMAWSVNFGMRDVDTVAGSAWEPTVAGRCRSQRGRRWLCHYLRGDSTA